MALKLRGKKASGTKLFEKNCLGCVIFQMLGKLCDLEGSQVKKNKFDVKKVVAVNSNFTIPWKIAHKDYIVLHHVFLSKRNENSHSSNR